MMLEQHIPRILTQVLWLYLIVLSQLADRRGTTVLIFAQVILAPSNFTSLNSSVV